LSCSFCKAWVWKFSADFAGDFFKRNFLKNPSFASDETSIAGIIFALTYFYFNERNKSGFFFTFLIHFHYNTYAFIIDDLIK
jgi:hypothetical protein